MRDKVESFNCNSTECMTSHACIAFEMTQSTKCKSNVRRHCTTPKTDDVNLCLKFYHDNNFIDASDIETKDRSQLIEEISVDSHGGGRRPSHLSHFPLDELQIIY